MISIVVAEDEPVARENIKLFINRYPEFRVIGEADNGNEALEKVMELQPDLLFSDIRMPGMDGVELLKQVHEKCRYTDSVVISAYSDFEYARSVMKSGALDYLLKPISPKQFKITMERLENMIHEKQLQARMSIFRAIIKNEMVEHNQLKKYFPFARYHMGLIRELGLPGTSPVPNYRELLSEIEGLNCIFGRDANEALYVWPEELMDVESFMEEMKRKPHDAYYTMVLFKNCTTVDEIPSRINELYNTLSRCLICGKTQCIKIEEKNKKNHIKVEPINVDDILFFVHKNNWREIKHLLETAFRQFEQEEMPLYQVKTLVDYALMKIAKEMHCEEDFSYFINELFCYSRNMKELCDGIRDYLQSCYQKNTAYNNKIDTEEFYNMVMKYVEENYKEPLTMMEICEKFSVSQSYMSRLFRKYTGVSFNEYLTNKRIERACLIFKSNRNMFVKDVANLVGIEDQFYFSRLFRRVMGMSPKQFCEQNSE